MKQRKENASSQTEEGLRFPPQFPPLERGPDTGGAGRSPLPKTTYVDVCFPPVPGWGRLFTPPHEFRRWVK